MAYCNTQNTYNQSSINRLSSKNEKPGKRNPNNGK